MLAPRGGFEPPTFRLTAESGENLSALSGVAYGKSGAIFPSLAAPNVAPKIRAMCTEFCTHCGGGQQEERRRYRMSPCYFFFSPS